MCLCGGSLPPPPPPKSQDRGSTATCSTFLTLAFVYLLSSGNVDVAYLDIGGPDTEKVRRSSSATAAISLVDPWVCATLHNLEPTTKISLTVKTILITMMMKTKVAMATELAMALTMTMTTLQRQCLTPDWSRTKGSPISTLCSMPHTSSVREDKKPCSGS